METVENKVILVTGSTDGLGKKVSRDLASKGAVVLLHGRNREKGGTVLREIQDAAGNDKPAYYNADFSSLTEVRQLAEEIQSDYDKLDVLINNAGIGAGKSGSGRKESRDNIELRFQVNYLSGFLLTRNLLPLLRKSGNSRIVNVASGAQHPIDFNDVMLEKNYSGNRAYGQSKLAQIMFTVELAGRLNDSGVTVNTLHPATYMNTNMVREAGISPATSVDKGAEAVEYLATSPELNNVTGEYFNGMKKSRPNDQVYDKHARKRLWELSEELVQPFEA